MCSIATGNECERKKWRRRWEIYFILDRWKIGKRLKEVINLNNKDKLLFPRNKMECIKKVLLNNNHEKIFTPVFASTKRNSEQLIHILKNFYSFLSIIWELNGLQNSEIVFWICNLSLIEQFGRLCKVLLIFSSIKSFILSKSYLFICCHFLDSK